MGHKDRYVGSLFRVDEPVPDDFHISHIPSEESTRLLVAFAKALISEDLEDAP